MHQQQQQQQGQRVQHQQHRDEEMMPMPTPMTRRRKQQSLSHVTYQLVSAVLLVVYSSLYSDSRVSGYSTGAGSCPLGRSAVSGSHLDTSGTKTIVRRGQPLKRLGLELQIDGQPVEPDSTNSSKPFALFANTDYKIHVVAVGLNSSKTFDNSTTATTKASSELLFFKGALIRIQTVNPKNLFTFLPGANATTALKCEYPAIGITHEDNTLKSRLGGTVNFQNAGRVYIDVTVVMVNDDTESNFAYSTYTQVKVKESLSSTPAPSQTVQTFAPTITSVPTITDMPTYGTECAVCGDLVPANYVVGNPGQTIQFAQRITTCGELEQTAQRQELHPLLCLAAQQAISSQNCNCIDPAAAGGGPATFTAPVPAPTYSTKCYVCNGNSSLTVTSISQTVTVQSGDGSGTNQFLTCGRLQETALSGRISPTLCQAFQTAVAISNNACNCQPIVVTAPLPAPSSNAVGGATFAPSLTKKPTMVPMPSFAPSDMCYACGLPGQEVVDRTRIANYFGYRYTCGQLYDVQSRIGVTDPSCPTYVTTVQTQCGCQLAIEDAGAVPTPTEPLVTFAPTVTEYPTVTSMPSYNELCYVCGNEKQMVSNPNAKVAVSGRYYTCGQIHSGGLQGHIPPSVCRKFIAATLANCDCQSSLNIIPTTNGTQSSSGTKRHHRSSWVIITVSSSLLLVLLSSATALYQ